MLAEVDKSPRASWWPRGGEKRSSSKGSHLRTSKGFPGGQMVKKKKKKKKNPPASAGDLGSSPGWEDPPGEGKGYPLQYSCLENPTDRGAWSSTVHRVSKSQTWLKWLILTYELSWIRRKWNEIWKVIKDGQNPENCCLLHSLPLAHFCLLLASIFSVSLFIEQLPMLTQFLLNCS